jgi:hypothetical protein
MKEAGTAISQSKILRKIPKNGQQLQNRLTRGNSGRNDTNRINQHIASKLLLTDLTNLARWARDVRWRRRARMVRWPVWNSP